MLLPSRRASTDSTHNSGEEIATTTASLDVDERPNLGMLASPLLTQEREKVQHHSGFITPTQKILIHIHHTFQPVRRDPGDVFAQDKVKSRFTCFARVSF